MAFGVWYHVTWSLVQECLYQEASRSSETSNAGTSGLPWSKSVIMHSGAAKQGKAGLEVLTSDERTMMAHGMRCIC